MEKKKKVTMIALLIIGGVLTTVFFIAVIVFYIFGPAILHMDRYKGEHPHLYTVAVNSLLTEGRISSFETYHAADVIKLNEDEYGRELFIYSGTPIALGEDFLGAHSVLICQKHDSEYAYWYESENFILAPYYGDGDEKNNGVEEDQLKGITEEQIEELKEKNDWGKAIDENKLSRAQIVREPLVKNVKRAQEVKAESFYNGLFAESGYDFRWCHSVVRDKDGRTIYYVGGLNTDLPGINYKYLIAVVSPEGEFYEDGWFVFDSPTGYAEDLKSIKEATGWNMKVV